MSDSRVPARREDKTHAKTLSATFIITLLIASAIIPLIPITHPIDNVEEKVRKYLLPGETIIARRTLKFSNVTLTIFNLSSGYYIIYSHNHGSVVLGDEWFLKSQPDDLALQLLSLLVYDELRPLERESKEYYRQLLVHASIACDATLEASKKELIIIGIIHLAAGIALLILTPPVGIAALVTFTADLALNLAEFTEKFHISPENSPRLFLALAMMPHYNDEALIGFKEMLNKLTDQRFWEYKVEIEKIREGTGALSNAAEMSQYMFMVAYILAASSPRLMALIEQTVGEEMLKNAGAFFLFNHLPREEAISNFEKFSKLVKSVWTGKGGAGELGDFILKRLTGTLKKVAAGVIIRWIRDYAIQLRDEPRTFIGFHGSHFLLARELSIYLIDELLKLENSLELPILNNIQKFFYFKYLLHLILAEYCEGVLKLSDNTLKSMHKEILDTWGFGNGVDVSNIRERFRFLKLNYETEANLTLANSIIYSSIVINEFEKYRKDMARRRGAIVTDEAGVKVFLVIDVSGSMAESFKGQRKIDAAKTAAKDFVSLMTRNDQVGLVKFSSTAALVSDLTNNKSSLIMAIDRLEPGGSTAIGDGIWLALDRLEATTGSKAVILLTDGRHNAGRRTPDEAAERARLLGIPVYTLGFGEKKDIDEETMKKVAEMTGGQYFYSPGPEELRFLYIALSQRVTGYVAEKVIVDHVKAGEVKEFVTTVSSGTPYLGVRLSYGGSKLSLELVSPRGYKLSFYESNVVYIEENGYAFVSVYNPEVGDWRIYVEGVETPPDGVEYRLVVLKPSVSASVNRLDLKMTAGDTREVIVRLRAMMDLASLELSVLDDIKGIIVSVEPLRVASVKEGQEIPVRIRFNVPVSPSTWLYTGGIQIATGVSRIYIPITVALDALFAAAFANTTELKPGRAVLVVVNTVDVAGKAVTGARVTATLEGRIYTFEDRGHGSYTAVLTGLKEGVHTLAISVAKEGYLPATCTIQITVRLLGDVNRDWVVDYRDIAILVSIYGSKMGQPNYNLDADINEDGEVNYRDLALLIGNYGKKV